MKKERRYRIIIGVLLLVVVFQWVFIILSRPKEAPKIPITVKGKIAIVIDDWGYNLNNLYILDQIRYPLTASVLPNLNYSQRVADELRGRGLEVILHLPMEPREKFRLEKNTIMLSMDKTEIINILRQGLFSVPHALGVSNHMGSLATEDPGVMEIIFRELKRRHLYFLDSIVSSKSICFYLARKMNLGFAKRDVFLDNQEDLLYIKGQIYKLKMKAKIYGEAIGIGHARDKTLEVLKEVMPELEKEGYKFVFVSELVH